MGPTRQGIEYGFSSNTRHRETAVQYAKVKDAKSASIILEGRMGMVDRVTRQDLKHSTARRRLRVDMQGRQTVESHSL